MAENTEPSTATKAALRWSRPVARRDGRKVVRLFPKEKATAKLANPIDRHVGERLAALRTERGLSQEQLAASLGARLALLQRFEAGLERIDAYRFRDIMRILDVPPSFFFEGFAPHAPKGGGV